MTLRGLLATTVALTFAGQALAQDFGIEQEAVLAIGDSVNDASMLRWAGRGVAMPHSDRYALDAADEVLTGTGISGVAALLRSLLRT